MAFMLLLAHLRGATWQPHCLFDRRIGRLFHESLCVRPPPLNAADGLSPPSPHQGASGTSVQRREFRRERIGVGTTGLTANFKDGVTHRTIRISAAATGISHSATSNDNLTSARACRICYCL
jgi:hypothetical protein